MNENIKNEVIEEVELVEETVETKEGFLTKAKSFVKRNGKKIAIGAVSVVGLGVAYALGKKSSGDSEEFEIDDVDGDLIEIEIDDCDTSEA